MFLFWLYVVSFDRGSGMRDKQQNDGVQKQDLDATVEFRKGTGSQVLGSWNKDARASSSFYRV